MTKRAFILYTILFAFLILLFICCILSIEVFIFMLLWNWITPLFWASSPILNFWQTFGFIMLLNLISGIIYIPKIFIKYKDKL